MIPKIIHYIWFGKKEKPKSVIKCINSWKKICPDYEIKEWNEDCFNVSAYPYIDGALKLKKYAYASDLVRLIAVYENGGFYFDTDVEIVKSIDDLRAYSFVGGFETSNYVNTGHGFGAEKHNEIVASMIAEYDDRVPDENGNMTFVGCPELNTNALVKHGLKKDGNTQIIGENGIVFSREYFNPLEDATGILYRTDKTYSIHWYTKNAFSLKSKIRNKFSRIYHRFFTRKYRR